MLAKVVSEVNGIEEDLQNDVKFNCKFVKTAPKRVVYENWQEAIMATC
jgi:hypothetical protein